jgi:hypothetical protein
LRTRSAHRIKTSLLPEAALTASNPAERGGWTKGDRLAVVFRNRQGGEVQANFQVDTGRPSQFSTSAPEDTSMTETHISAGTLPYFLFFVWYDDQRRLVGLRRR